MELVDLVTAGTLNVARDYYLRLAEEGADVDDLRKALEIGAKVMGAMQPEKMDNLLQVSWTINGGSVTFESKSSPSTTELELEMVTAAKPQGDIVDVEAKTLAQDAAEPAADPTAKFEMVDNMLDGI